MIVFIARKINAIIRLNAGVIPNISDEIMYRPSVMPSDPGVMFINTVSIVIVARYRALSAVIS